MKGFIKICMALVVSSSAYAQGVDDMVSMEANYTNQVFYSFENGEVSSVTNLDWNIAFSLSGEGALGSSILLNEGTSQLWGAPLDTNAWLTFDSTGYLNAWEQLLNSDTSWTNGAFNKYRGQDSFFDMGWGDLDPSNNYWTFGDSLYLIKLGDGSFKKLWIESLKTGVWSFKYADPDGSNENSISITKADYSNKNFVYVSLENGTLIDREPDNTTWDIMFTKHTDYVSPPGMFIGVTSVFNNIGLYTAYSNEIDLASALNATMPQTDYNQDVINIGRTWKKRVSGNWVVRDTIAYFAWNIDSTDLYRIVFTDFEGQTTGKTYFNIEKIATAGVDENSSELGYSIYPNPTSNDVTIVLPNENAEQLEFKLFNINGEVVLQRSNVLNLEKINIEHLPAGIYVYQLLGKTENAKGKLIIR